MGAGGEVEVEGAREGGDEEAGEEEEADDTGAGGRGESAKWTWRGG